MRTEPDAPHCTVQIDIPFHDIDSLGVVWHGHYYKYFELARTALLRKYGFDIPQLHDMGYSMVVIDSQCRYIRPIRYGMQIKVHARIVELEYRIKINYRITCANRDQRLAKGTTIQATLDAEQGTLIMVTPQDVVDIFLKNKADLGE